MDKSALTKMLKGLESKRGMGHHRDQEAAATKWSRIQEPHFTSQCWNHQLLLLSRSLYCPLILWQPLPLIPLKLPSQKLLESWQLPLSRKHQGCHCQRYCQELSGFSLLPLSHHHIILLIGRTWHKFSRSGSLGVVVCRVPDLAVPGEPTRANAGS